MYVDCPFCVTSGECHKCSGTGKNSLADIVLAGMGPSCSLCGGTGVCPACGGSGEIDSDALEHLLDY